VNVANLLLVRAAGRRQDIAVKIALGAGGGRIARTLLLESVIVGVLGSVLGCLLGVAGVRGLLALIPVPLPAWMRIEVDGPVLLVSMAVGLATSVLFGLMPALASRRVSMTDDLRSGARGSTRSPVRAGLVVAEVALTVVLLMGAGLLLKTFANLQARDPGFRGDGVISARVVLWATGPRVQSAGVLSQIHERVIAALRQLPGVQVAAVTNVLPYAGAGEGRIQADIFIEGRAAEHSKTLAPISGADVSADYFRAMSIPLVRGRLFEPTDTPTSDPVIVISERAAELFFPGRDPLGERISWGQVTDANPWTRVVGVVGNVKQRATEGERGVEFYYPMTQWPATTSHYVVRTEGDPAAMGETIRRAIVGAEPTAAVSTIKTLERTMGESLWQQRLWGILFTAFAAVALALAAVGLYGVLSYAVAQRTREMGLRVALGAAPSAVRGLIVGEGLRLCGVGTVVGLAAALGLGRLATSLLVDVAPYDVATVASVIVLVTAAAVLACWVPARRASRVDPLVALHQD
jgi:putative ABC transport system permease protein